MTPPCRQPCTSLAPTDLLQPLHEPGGQRGGEMEQEGLLLQLPQGGCEPEGWMHGGHSCHSPTSAQWVAG